MSSYENFKDNHFYRPSSNIFLFMYISFDQGTKVFKFNDLQCYNKLGVFTSIFKGEVALS